MGKEGDLWDDSALIKAFDNAISKYKIMHKTSGSDVEQKVNTDKDEALTTSEADDGSNMFGFKDANLPKDDNAQTQLKTTAESGENVELSPVKANSSDVQNGTNGRDSVVNPSDVQTQIETAWYSSAPEEYNQLLNKYYELEGQRQQILQQINQYDSWNSQHSMTNASTNEYKTCVPQPYGTVTCYCPYGCQNWAVPINSIPACCSGGNCDDKSFSANPREINSGNSASLEDPNFVKTAMLAAKRALSSLKKEPDGVKDKQVGMEVSEVAEGTKSSTDLDVVLSAWYNAGFYTGKYLAQQSTENSRHSHSP